MKKIVIEKQEGMRCNLDLGESSLLYPAAIDNRQQILPLFPVCYGYFYANGRHFTERYRCNPLYQVFVTHKGYGQFLVGKQKFISGPNTVVFLDLSKPHRYETLGDLWEHEWVNFSGPLCGYYDRLINAEGVAERAISNDAIKTDMHQIQLGIQDHCQKGQLNTFTLILRLLYDILDNQLLDETAGFMGRYQTIQSSVRHMRSCYGEKVSVDTLARRACLSKYHYCRLFKRIYGITPYEYLTNIRVSQAQNLLITSDLSVEEIGWKVGYAGGKGLIRQFKDVTGMTPGKYRLAYVGKKEGS